MGKLLIIFILIVFANCSEEQNVLVTKKGGGSFVNSFSTTDYMDELIPFLMMQIKND